MRGKLIGIRIRQGSMRWFGLMRAMCVIFFVFSGCTPLPTLQEIAPEINATLEPSPVFLIPDDQIEVAFPSTPEWDHTVTVRADGRASFYFLDEMVVAGMTVERLNEILTVAYHDGGTIAVDHTVTVNLGGLAVRRAILMGEVQNPGTIDIEGGHLSLLEAIGKAGGPLKASADLSEVLLVRWMPREGGVRTWQFDASLSNWVAGTPLLLQAHDVVFVPNTTIDGVNLWVDKYIRQMLPIPIFPTSGIIY